MDELKTFFRYGQWKGSQETICGRGSSLEYTEYIRSALPLLLTEYKIKSIVDAPCGDLNWISRIDLSGLDYTGVDIVPEIIEENKKKYPKYTFIQGDITSTAFPPADLLMTRDCLFHLPMKNIAGWMSNIRQSRPRWILVTCNTNDINYDLETPGQYRPINLTKPPFSFPKPPEERIIRDYPDGNPERYMYLWSEDEYQSFITPEAIGRVNTYNILKENHKSQPNTANLQQSERSRGNPYLTTYRKMKLAGSLLDDIIAVSQEKLGFFTSHPPRAYEYPRILRAVTSTKGPVVDLGAGLSPLPFMLSAEGRRVYTVDYSSLKRNPATRNKWSEWGFLDCQLIDERIKSFNVDFSTFNSPEPNIGCIYSTSVIEHMPAHLRRSIFRTISDILAPSGNFIATIDLVPGSDALWNFDRGKRVDSTEKHGRISTLMEELTSVNIGIENLEVKRNLPGSATDILFIKSKKLG